MIEKIIQKIVINKINNLKQYGYEEDNINISMQANLRHYLDKLKVIDVKDINFNNPTEQDLILYLVYSLEAQKQNDIEALDNIRKIIDFKIDVHKDNIQKDEVDNIIELYKTQIKLK